MDGLLRERARAEGPRRAADRDRPSSAPSWWRDRAAPLGYTPAQAASPGRPPKTRCGLLGGLLLMGSTSGLGPEVSRRCAETRRAGPLYREPARFHAGVSRGLLARVHPRDRDGEGRVHLEARIRRVL